MKTHLDSIVTSARDALRTWFEQEKKLCQFKSAVYDGEYYSTPQGQAWYLLKFYPAYYAEYYLLYKHLQRVGVTDPHIISLGCGSMVDAAAATKVFSNGFTYTGYDRNEWSISNRCYTLINQDLKSVNTFANDASIFIFPRSIGDLVGCYTEIANAISSSTISSDTIWVCSSLRVTGDSNSITGDDGNFSRFIGQISDFGIDLTEVYHPATLDSEKNLLINRKIETWWHSELNFCRRLLNECKTNNKCSESCENEIKPMPIVYLKNIAYKFVKLKRRACIDQPNVTQPVGE